MNDTLHDLMRDSAETIPTSAPPIAAITRAGRRRRTRAVALATAAAVVVLSGTAAVAVPLLDEGQRPSPAGQGSNPTPSGGGDVPVFLPTSSWEVGVDSPVEHATVTGELVATRDDRCVVVGDDQTPVFWPQGFEGETHGDGSFALLDEKGRPVAEAGDTVRLTGRWLEPASWSGDELCIPDDRRVFMVQAQPDVVP